MASSWLAQRRGHQRASLAPASVPQWPPRPWINRVFPQPPDRPFTILRQSFLRDPCKSTTFFYPSSLQPSTIYRDTKTTEFFSSLFLPLFPSLSSPAFDWFVSLLRPFFTWFASLPSFSPPPLFLRPNSFSPTVAARRSHLYRRRSSFSSLSALIVLSRPLSGLCPLSVCVSLSLSHLVLLCSSQHCILHFPDFFTSFGVIANAYPSNHCWTLRSGRMAQSPCCYQFER